MASATLVVLALIAYGTLKNRSSFSDSLKLLTDAKRSVRANEFFLSDKLISDQTFASANHVAILGMTLTRTTREYIYALGQRLIAGAKIQLVLLDPTSDNLLEELALRSNGTTTVDYWRSRLQTVQTVINVIAETPNAKGKLEVGYLPYIPSFGFTMIDPDSQNGICFVELYHHKSAKPNPTFVLRSGVDADWYVFFRGKFEILWKSCRVEELTAPKS